MANATIGSNPGSVNDWIFDASMHECWIGSYSVSALGRMIQVDCLGASAASGGTGSAVGYLNTVFTMQTSPAPSLPVGSGTSGSSISTTNGGVDVPTAPTDSWQFGFWASKGVWVIYHDDGGSTFVKASAGANATGGTNVSAYAGRTGSMRAYGTYFVIEFYKRSGSSWLKRYMGIRRSGSTTTDYKVSVRRGGAWTQVGERAENIEFDPSREFQIMCQDENGIWLPGIARWEGPYYIGVGFEPLPHIYPYKLVA